MRPLCIILVSLAFAFSAEAQTWRANPDGTGKECRNILRPKDICYLVITSTAALDSPIISIANLADVCFDPELEGTGTSTAEVAIRKCQGQTASVNECERVTVDVDGDGDVDNGILDGDSGSVSATQRMCIYDLGPGHYFVEVPTDPGGGETALVTMTGH